jgi:acyl-CoA reductase-like NAD-dependent aldehyde dehydrogenase
MTQVHLELGDKDPAHIRADADVEAPAADRAVLGRFSKALAEGSRKWTLSHPFHDKAMLGPVVNAAAAARIRDQVAQAIAGGARRFVGSDGGTNTAYVPALVTHHLSGSLDSAAVPSRWSRIFLGYNRFHDDWDCVRPDLGGIPVPGNLAVDAAERATA